MVNEEQFNYLAEILVNSKVKAARLMITDLCPYSCQSCAVYTYKQNPESESTNFGGNEGALVRDYVITHSDYLGPDDYGFLAKTLPLIGIQDFTLTGGDPFVRRDFGDIVRMMKQENPNSRITALTKGAPLFAKSPQEIREAVGPIDRIIFSLDTLDPIRHAHINLPLINFELASSFLPRTLDALSNTIAAGYEVEINTVVPPFETQDDLGYVADIIKYAYEVGIKRVKLIELDSPDVVPGYIESLPEYLNLGDGYYMIINKNTDLTGKNNTIVAKVFSRTDSTNALTLSAHRVDCASSKISQQMICGFDNTGELLMNTTGEVNPCRYKPKDNIDMLSAIKQRDQDALVIKFYELMQRISHQKCPMIVHVEQ